MNARIVPYSALGWSYATVEHLTVPRFQGQRYIMLENEI